jgi:hypothetical protein
MSVLVSRKGRKKPSQKAQNIYCQIHDIATFAAYFATFA